jgi:hypothetical protein
MAQVTTSDSAKRKCIAFSPIGVYASLMQPTVFPAQRFSLPTVGATTVHVD